MFSGSSLFSNSNITKGSSLFSNLPTNNNLFSNSNTNKEDDEEDNDNEEVFKKESEAVIGFNPENQPQESEYNKLFVKQVDNLYIFSKDEKKFVSKGKGFISLEKHKEKNTAFVIFRNAMGVKLLEGFFTAHTKPVDKISKNYKSIASFGAIEFKDNKPSLKICKIPVSLYMYL